MATHLQLCKVIEKLQRRTRRELLQRDVGDLECQKGCVEERGRGQSHTWEVLEERAACIRVSRETDRKPWSRTPNVAGPAWKEIYKN